MKMPVFILAQKHFSDMIEKAVQQEDIQVVGCSDDYVDVWKRIQPLKPAALIIQISHPVYIIQNLIADLSASRYSVNLLVFDCSDGKSVYYATSHGKDTSQFSRLKESFCAALKGRYDCVHLTYRDDKWNARFGITSTISYDRTEGLIEILRGISTENFKKFQQMYNYNLKQKGYYLFICELMDTINYDHIVNRDCYNFIGNFLEQEFIDVLEKYNGGEVFYLLQTSIYLYVNDLDIVSVSRKAQELTQLIKQLCHVGSRKTAFCFISPCIEKIEGIRSFHELYQRNKTNHFFCYEKHPMTEAELSPPLYSEDYETIQKNLDLIGNAIRYDNNIERASQLIRHLFVSLVKPSYDLDLYYYCFNVIKRIILSEYRPAAVPPELIPVSSSIFMFGSIEDHCEKIIRLLDTLSQAHINQSHLKYHYVHDTVDYIKEHYMANLSLADIADAIQVNSAYLSQLFKRKTGVTIIQYLIKYRVRMAEKYLKSSDIPVSEIASMVGFNDAKHFSKTFKSITDLSPLQYRKHTEPKVKIG